MTKAAESKATNERDEVLKRMLKMKPKPQKITVSKKFASNEKTLKVATSKK